LNINQGQLQDMEWTDLGNMFFHEVESMLERQYDRMLGDDGQIIRDLDTQLDRFKIEDFTTDDAVLMNLLGIMREGTRMFFDRKSHKRRVAATLRLNYSFLAGQLLQGRSTTEITELVLEHLQGAQKLLGLARGHFEWGRLVSSGSTLDQLEEGIQVRLQEVMGADRFIQVSDKPLHNLTPDEQKQVQEVLGWFRQNDVTRQLLLNVISSQWVDYLTKVEAVRVSIGLEAYAQRDPLVQYKSRASEMFKELMADIRSGVISHMFTFRQHQSTSVLSDVRGDGLSADGGGLLEEPVPAGMDMDNTASEPAQAQSGGNGQAQGKSQGKSKKKRKRH
jgi:preprotein translocase subunit SecA